MQFFNILTLVNSQEGLLLSQILSAGRGTSRIGEQFHHPKLSILKKIDNFINKWLLGHHQLVCKCIIVGYSACKLGLKYWTLNLMITLRTQDPSSEAKINNKMELLQCQALADS